MLTFVIFHLQGGYMDYYNEIKNELIDNEITKKVKDYGKNRSDLTHYYNVGKLLIEAQGGETRAKYGDGLIKEYSEKLSIDLGKGYSTRTLKLMRKFYLFQKGQPVVAQFSWTHYTILMSLTDSDEINYYINESIKRNLCKRELQLIIKNKEYQRLDSKTRNKIISNEETTIVDFIKNPIIIRNSLNIENISEKYLKKIILENISDFMEQLGEGFSFIKDEYKIKIGDKFNYIDILLFNYKYNAFVVVELKIIELKKEHIGQIEVYMNYVDRHIKSINHDKTIGVIICKHDNKLVLEYCSDKRIFSTTYEITC